MAGFILMNLRKILDASNKTTKAINKADSEVATLIAKAKETEAAGDTVRYFHLMEKATKLASDTLKAAEKAGVLYKGNGVIGARISYYIPKKIKEGEALIKQFIKNVEMSKVYDQGIIKSTSKTINPFNGG